MNKLKKLLTIFAVTATIGAGVAGIAGCDGCGDNDNGGGHQHDYTWTDNKNGTHDGHCDADGCDKPDVTGEGHIWDTDGNCVCGAVKPADNTHDHTYASDYSYDLKNHFKECTVDGCDDVDELGAHEWDTNNVCGVCGIKYAAYELIPSDMEATKNPDGIKTGVFTIVSGTEVRGKGRNNQTIYDYQAPSSMPLATNFNSTKSVKVGSSGNGITVNTIAPGRIILFVENGSSDKVSTLSLERPDGSKETIEYNKSGMCGIVIDCPVKGEYKFMRGSNTTDVHYVKYETVVEVTPVESIKVVDGGKVTFTKGEEFDYSKLQLQIVRKTTGITEPLAVDAEGVDVDFSDYKKDVPGKYTIKVTYKVGDETFEDEYTVIVKSVASLELGFNGIVVESGTYNGLYINHTVKQFYFNDEEFDSTGLTVKTVLDEESKEMVTVKEGFTIEGFEKGKAGKQTIKVYWNDAPEIYKEFDVYVAGYTAANVTEDKQININVDASLDDNAVGVRSNGAYQFKTIQQSLDFLNKLTVDKNIKKVINLAEGLYKEKLEVNVPNLIIKGADNAHPEKTIIEWDSLWGKADESGFIHETDSTATLSVRESAVGFVIEGVTISNWYNSTANFEEAFGKGYNGEHRALAMLVQADKVVIDNCRILGYQDTIELFTGRQVVSNTYICGRTDFIFGTNNTTYFKDCTIESIVDGGYVTAFKGCNKVSEGVSNDWVDYGAVFDGCEFIAPKAVEDKKDTSLGRAWEGYAAVAFVNCDFGAHISTKGYAENVKGVRYTKLNADPTGENIKFVEYNNSGDGNISAQVAGMKLITDETVGAKYSDLSVIFGKVNGKVNYNDAWDGEKGVEINTVDYKFNSTTFPGGNVSASTEDAETEIFGGVMTVHGIWNTQLTIPDDPNNQNKDFAWFKAGTQIVFNETGTVYITTYGSNYGLPENIKINYKDGKATVTIVATKTSPITGNCCITLIQINPKEVPEHVHEYGEWEITKVPEADKEGEAVKTCLDCETDPAGDVKVTLPVLNKDSGYTADASENEGNLIYLYEYEGETISFEAGWVEGFHAHNYSEWGFEEGEKPTLTDGGVISRSCNDEDCTDTVNHGKQQLTLPALNSSAYTITGNTADVNNAGTGTYTITVDGVTVSFEAETPQKAEQQVFAFAALKGASEDGKYFNEEITMNGSYTVRPGNTCQTNVGTTIVMHDAGKVSIEWHSGYGNDKNAKITYTNNVATIEIVAPAGGAENGKIYISKITLDRTTTSYTVWFNENTGSDEDVSNVSVGLDGNVTKPETDPTRDGYIFKGWCKDAAGLNPFDFENDTVSGDAILYAKWGDENADNYTVTVNVWGNPLGEVEVADGDELAIAQVEALLGETYADYTVALFTDAALTTPFDGTVSGDMTIYAGVIATKAVTYNYAQSATADEVNTPYFNFKDYDNSNGSWLTYGGEKTISVYVTAGTVITFNRSPYETNTTVTVNETDMPDCADDGNTIIDVSYTATEDGIVTISANGTAYLRKITVTPAIRFNVGDSVNLIGSGLNLSAGQSAEYQGLSITTRENDGRLQDTNNGTSDYIHLGAGTVIAFKVEDGVTFDNMQVLLVEYQGNETQYNAHFTYVIENGICTVTVGSNTLYIKEIKLVAKS